jgi:adenylate cyclase
MPVSTKRSSKDPQHALLELLHIAGGGTVLLFGAVFWFLDLRGAAMVETVYGLFTLSTLCWLMLSPRAFRAVVWLQAVGVSFVPLGVTLALGGPEASGGFGVWGLLGPLAAMMFLGRRGTWIATGVFLATLLAGAVVPPAPPGPWFQPPPRWLVHSLGVANIAGGSMLAMATLSWFVRRLRFEQRRADALLMSTLPPELGRALAGRPEHGSSLHGVTVLMVDIVDLGSLGARLGAGEMADLLSGLFGHFQRIAGRFSCMSVRTMGEAFLVVFGLPEANPRHALDAAELALAMRGAVASRRFAGHRVELRIGLSSGAIPPGSAGRRRFIYELWGRTVSLVARMEARGGPGCILVTQASWELLHADYRLRPSGLRTSSASGSVEAWDLLERKDED